MIILPLLCILATNMVAQIHPHESTFIEMIGFLLAVDIVIAVLHIHARFFRSKSQEPHVAIIFMGFILPGLGLAPTNNVERQLLLAVVHSALATFVTFSLLIAIDRYVSRESST